MNYTDSRLPLRKHIANLPRYVAGSHRITYHQPNIVENLSSNSLQAILSANENPHGAGKGARNASLLFLKNQILHRYPELEQEQLLLEEIIESCAIQEQQRPTSEQLLLANGSDELITLLVQATIASGDNALVCSNSFPVYNIALRAADAEVREVSRLKPLYSLDINGLGELCDRKTKLFFVANPDNPTGKYENINNINQILSVLPPWVLLVLDGAYAEYTNANDYDSGMKWACQSAKKTENSKNSNSEKSSNNTRTSTENSSYDSRVVMLRTFSKIHGLAALRIGWALGAPHIISAMRALRMPFSVNALAIVAAIAALRDKKHVLFSQKENAEQRARFTSFARENGLSPLPSQANFVMLDCKTTERAQALEQLWRVGGFITRSCAHNGLPHAVRVTIGSKQEMSALMKVKIKLPDSKP